MDKHTDPHVHQLMSEVWRCQRLEKSWCLPSTSWAVCMCSWEYLTRGQKVPKSLGVNRVGSSISGTQCQTGGCWWPRPCLQNSSLTWTACGASCHSSPEHSSEPQEALDPRSCSLSRALLAFSKCPDSSPQLFDPRAHHHARVPAVDSSCDSGNFPQMVQAEALLNFCCARAAQISLKPTDDNEVQLFLEGNLISEQDS